MSAIRDALARLAKSLAGQAPPSSLVGPSDGDAEFDPMKGNDEFADLLDGLGSQPDGEDAGLRLKDAQIAELQTNLANFRDLGDQLAETERARLALLDRVDELEQQAAASPLEKPAPEAPTSTPSDERRIAQLKKALDKEHGRYEKLLLRFDAAREKAAERHRVAADRWHELRRMGRERRDLEDQLRTQRLKLEQVQGALPGRATGAVRGTAKSS